MPHPLATGCCSARRLRLRAASVGVSPRHLKRLFRAEVGTTPAHWLEQVRIDAARPLILEGRPITVVAQLCGFGTGETLRRAFARQLGTTPTAFRERFSTTAPQRRASLSLPASIRPGATA